MGGTSGSSGSAAGSLSDSGATSESGGAGAGDANTPAGEGGAGNATQGEAGAGDIDNPWHDVAPSRMRIGPLTEPRILFQSDLQLAGYWETPSGDVLTSFRTSITHPEPGIAIDDYNYTLETVVGAAIDTAPNVDMGACRYQDPPYGTCTLPLDPDGPSGRSLVANDGTILLMKEKPVGNSMASPIVARLDPDTGTTSTLLELPDLPVRASDSAYTATFVLHQLGDDTVSLSMSSQGTTASTVVFDTAGQRRAARDGFAFGDRWQRFALFVGADSSSYNARFDWWDPTTDGSVRAFGFPTANPKPSFRTLVTPAGVVLFPGFTYTDRLLQLDEDGTLVEDRALPAWSWLTSLPDGRYLTLEKDDTLGYVVNAYGKTGAATLLYDQATLMQDAAWPPLQTDVNHIWPAIAPLEFGAVADDAGNAFVGFVLQTGGNTTTRTYLVAFAPDGHKLWGVNIDSTRDGACLPESFLSGNRLVVRCPGRYVRRFLIYGN